MQLLGRDLNTNSYIVTLTDVEYEALNKLARAVDPEYRWDSHYSMVSLGAHLAWIANWAENWHIIERVISSWQAMQVAITPKETIDETHV